ncbi:hypothetical protein B0H16DRAFT_1349276, partial [Mycena metata]
LLADASVEISFQIIYLVQANIDDDPTQHHDWQWSLNMDGPGLRAPGCLVQPLNSTLSLRGAKLTCLFDSSELLIIAATLHEQILPRAQASQGTAKSSCHIEEDLRSCCNDCTPAVLLNLTKGQCVLEHVAAPQLYDPKSNHEHGRCGLCNSPAATCVFFLIKGRGSGAAYSIDWEQSRCAQEVHFQYAVTTKSKIDGKTHPVPMFPSSAPPANHSSPKKAAPWKHNLPSYFQNFHKLENPVTWPMNMTISDEEKSALKVIWDNIHQPAKPRKSCKARKPMKISEAHSTNLALW